MIRGMTGFGSAQFSDGNFKAVVEIKSLNHRYLDVVYYLPAGFSVAENKIRVLIQKNIERGRISVFLKLFHKSQTEIFLNTKAVSQYLRYAKQLERNFRLKNDLALSDLIRLPGVVEAKEAVVSPEDAWGLLEKYFAQALQGLIVMKKREGKSLAADISGNLKRMTAQIQKVRQRVEVVLREKRKSFSLEEFQSFQKNSDIHEEISRLEHYIEELSLLLKNDKSIGKNIDFIAQEMQRETNTIGSKLLDKTVSNAVIALKSRIEKIREQSQNIE